MNNVIKLPEARVITSHLPEHRPLLDLHEAILCIIASNTVSTKEIERLTKIINMRLGKIEKELHDN
jgi:hypothetical protein